MRTQVRRVGKDRALRGRIHIGLRDRVILTYALLTLVLSTLLAVSVWLLVSHYLVNRSESAAVATGRVNADSVTQGLVRQGSAVPELLDHLATPRGSFSLLNHDAHWYATSPTHGPRTLPHELVDLVRTGSPGTQRVDVDGNLMMVVGVPLRQQGDGYFEVTPLDELRHTLRLLQLTLAVAAAAMALCALAVGLVASKVALRPLAELTRVAVAVARGEPGARLHGEKDPDLGGLARSFNQTAAELERRVAADARFAGDVSHELRTPLTTMLNSMEVVQNRSEQLDPAVREPLALLAEDLERFRRLVVDLIEISRSDIDDRPDREPVLVADAVRRAADAAAGREVTVVAASAARVVLEVDKRRLERVVTNLVENAEQHGRGCVQVAVEAAESHLRIRVDDQGPGIPRKQRKRIFERFVRSSGQAGTGVGLGLAIVARHVQLHEGSIHVEDRPGGGSRFVVLLPDGRG